MQLIRSLPCDVENYAAGEYALQIRPPPECPHCHQRWALWALGYYRRNVSRLKPGHLRILIRRFRCRRCHKTVSILPAFAQPYRFVQNGTIERFVRGGPWASDVLRLFPLLQLYWRRFVSWLPELEKDVTPTLPRPPPSRVPSEWWDYLMRLHGDLDTTTLTLTSTHQITLFGRYRCHRSSRPQDEI